MATVIPTTTTTPSTANASSYAAAAFTPALGDLIVVVFSASGTVGVGDATDNQGGTYTLVNSAVRTSADTLYILVRDQLVGTAASTTVTCTLAGDAGTGAEIHCFRVAGIFAAGLTAIRQSAKQNNNTGGTPAPVFSVAALTTNPLIGAISIARNPPALTAPSGWAEAFDHGHTNPIAGTESVYRNSGFTGTTVTWGTSTGTVDFASLVVEIDGTTTGGAAPTLTTVAAVAALFTSVVTAGALVSVPAIVAAVTAIPTPVVDATTGETGVNVFIPSEVAATTSIPTPTVTAGAYSDMYVVFESHLTDDDDHFEVYDIRMAAQSFLSATAHTLVAVGLMVYREGTPPNDLVVEIFETDINGDPTGSPLGEGTLVTSGSIGTIHGYIYRVAMDPVPIEANTLYAIVLSTTGGTAANDWHWVFDNTAADYPNGEKMQFIAAAWSASPTHDFLFQEFGPRLVAATTTVPTPAITAVLTVSVPAAVAAVAAVPTPVIGTGVTVTTTTVDAFTAIDVPGNPIADQDALVRSGTGWGDMRWGDEAWGGTQNSTYLALGAVVAIPTPVVATTSEAIVLTTVAAVAAIPAPTVSAPGPFRRSRVRERNREKWVQQGNVPRRWEAPRKIRA